MAGEKAGASSCLRLLPWKVLEGPLNIYKKACAAHGHQPDIVYIRPVYIDQDEKQIRKEVEQALLNFLAFNALQWNVAERREEGGTACQRLWFLCQWRARSLTKLTYDEIVGQEIGFIGTPEKIIRQSTCWKSKAASVSWRSSPISAGWSTEERQDATHVRQTCDAGVSSRPRGGKSGRLTKEYAAPSAVQAERSD